MICYLRAPFIDYLISSGVEEVKRERATFGSDIMSKYKDIILILL